MIKKIRFIAFREGSHWVAVGKEKYLAAQADTFKELWNSIHLSVIAQVVCDIEHGQPILEILKPSPKDVQRLFEEAVRVTPHGLRRPTFKVQWDYKKLRQGEIGVSGRGAKKFTKVDYPEIELWIGNTPPHSAAREKYRTQAALEQLRQYSEKWQRERATEAGLKKAFAQISRALEV